MRLAGAVWALAVVGGPAWLRGDAGVLIPSDRQEPDPRVLSLEEMAVDVRIDNGVARVAIRQIFASHWNTVLEGNYVFALPGRATVSDFAIWDDVTRIPGVILERRRAEEIYAETRRQAIDPGLLQMGEHGIDEARRTSVFSARVVPIPPQGYKRVEIEYYETLPAEDLRSFFALPLRPSAYQTQTAGRLSISFELRSAHPVREFEAGGKAYPLVTRERTPNLIRAGFEGEGVQLVEDFAVRWALEAAPGTALQVLTHRDSEPGFFQASLLLPPPAAQNAAARTVVLLFDASLSMQWEKLERSFQALEAILRSLRPADRFNLFLYNTEVIRFRSSPVPAAPTAVEQALSFVKAGRLKGGTNLQAALEAALGQAAPGCYLVVLSDGGATRGLIHNGKLAEWYARRWKTARPHTYVFAVGDDANIPLLTMLARNDGLLEWVRSSEPVEFKLNAFISKIGRRPLEGLKLTAAPAENFDLIYPMQESAFPGSLAGWVGQYRKPLPRATFSAHGATASAPLPERSLEHAHLPRTWARARVDALLEKIEREGEDQATVDEIIRLARKYKFVTPYTSFLAAPRALLRPRLIRPGDPVLRVRTDPSIKSVVAMFPFGLIKELRYLPQEEVWQTRFLAPRNLPDGTHRVRLILRDGKGQVFRESKTFVIVSKPPSLRVRTDRNRVPRGGAIRLKVSASETTRTITARMYGAAPVALRWNPQAGASTGELHIPAHLAAGSYKVTVTAEDFAHNMASREVEIEVLP